MKCISLEDVILFHNKIIACTGGRPGIRDIGLIDSALHRGFTTFEGNELFDGIYEKISAITYSIINNHGFVDGNKRIGVAVMILLLKLNKIAVQYTKDKLVELGLKVADGTWKEHDIIQWIQQHKI